MYGFSERPPAAARIFRFFVLLIPATQARLLLSALASWPRMLGIYLILSLAGAWMGRSRLRPWVRLALAAALPFALRWAVFAAFRIAGAAAPGFGADSLFPAFDETFFPLLPLWFWAVAAADAAGRSRTFAAVEVGAALVLLAALSWSQSGFRVTLYPHPSLLAAAAAGLLFLALAVLAALAPRGSGKSPGYPIRAAATFALLLLVLLAVLGRYAAGAAARGGGLLQPTLLRFDLTRYLKLETEISLSDDLILIVRKDPVDPNILIRRFVLSEYARRGGFRLDPSLPGVPDRLPRGPSSWEVPSWSGREPLEQEYWILHLEPGALLAVDAPVSAIPYRLDPGSSFVSAYSLVSSAPAPSLPLLLEGFDPGRTPPGFALSKVELERYTRWSGDPRIRRLAEEAVGEAVAYYDKVAAVLAYLRNNYYYSLKPGVAPDGDQLAYFLFGNRKGYCSYFAFSMTLLLRSVGIPARVAAGFFLDPGTAVLDFHPVRADMAHAWTEVWFGEYGWVAFDPTSREPAPGERFEESRGTDPALLESLLREILRGTREPVPGAEREAGTGPSPAEVLGEAALWVLRRLWLFAPLLWLALAAAPRLIRALRIRAERDRRRRLLWTWALLEGTLETAGARRARGESPVDFADRLDREGGIAGGGWGAAARRWERLVYDPSGDAAESRAEEELLVALGKRVRSGTPPLRRALAFLDLRRAWRRSLPRRDRRSEGFR